MRRPPVVVRVEDSIGTSDAAALARRPWDVAWEGTPSWETGRPQPVVDALLAAGDIDGAVLDVGCGSGRHALLLAVAGHRVTGIDIVPGAIDRARRLAGEECRSGTDRPRFVVGDARQLERLAPLGMFDTALDVGLFHVLQPEEVAAYAAGLAAVVRPGGRAIVVAWSDRNPFGLGPGRIRRRDLRRAFTRATGWRVDAIEEARLESSLLPGGAHAWLARLTRR